MLIKFRWNDVNLRFIQQTNTYFVKTICRFVNRMKLLDQKNIDRKRWDNLVLLSDDATIYNQSIFLDELAENWMLLVNDEYTIGLPIPFAIRLGVKGIYTPNFIRTIDWVGLNSENQQQIILEAESILKEKFKSAHLKMVETHFEGMSSDLMFQEVQDVLSMNSQAKRSIKKFIKSNLVIQNVQIQQVLTVVSEELTEKVKDLNENDINRFESLLTTYPAEKLWVIGVLENNEVVGGLVFIKWKNTFHYVKGGARKSAKDLGAMYAMMELAIKYAFDQNLKVDFGGSNVAGVRQFNAAFGGKDVNYSEWKWDNSPFWFKLLKKLKNR